VERRRRDRSRPDGNQPKAGAPAPVRTHEGGELESLYCLGDARFGLLITYRGLDGASIEYSDIRCRPNVLPKKSPGFRPSAHAWE
jgi:hypothetical protein